ncbi:MAG: DNA translocase FtsK 4TM domain-containing protein [Alphaproteobacteria bacterium]|nr:DNA translocase FtsK 4TM domain-containing protein [Alphaproteobacteria bacterium]
MGEKQHFLPTSWSIYLHRLAWHVAGLIVILIGVCLAIALLTYNDEDPSLNVAVGEIPTNWMGLFGAYFSDFMWQFFGYSCLLVPSAIIAWGIIVYRRRWRKIEFWRLPCLIPTMISVMGICQLFPEIVTWPTIAGPSGAVYRAGLIKVIPFWVLQFIYFLGALYFGVATLGIPFKKLRKFEVWVGKLIWSMLVAGFKFIFCKKQKNGIVEKDVQSEDIESEENYVPESIMPEIQDEQENVDIQGNLDLGDKSEQEEVQRRVKAKLPPVEKKMTTAKKKEHYVMPSEDLLKKNTSNKISVSKEYLEKKSRQLEQVLAEYGVNGEVTGAHPGPVITLFEFSTAPGVKTSRVTNLASEVTRKMEAVSVRIAPVPGKSYIGIELPNDERADVGLRELISAKQFKENENLLTVSLGKDIGGGLVYANLAKMPHLLVAGTTGSGKSVAVNAMILSMLYRLTPEQVRFILIDPKKVEFSSYENIPHLIAPVVTDMKKVSQVLNWAVRQMEDRITLMSKIGVRNIDGFNARVREMIANGEPMEETKQAGFDEDGRPIFETTPLNLSVMPYIVIVVDEFADLMQQARKEVEPLIQRIAQKARAAGIHLILATQRPSVDVITGVIKANIPERISCRLMNGTDSRTILGMSGAEQLLGKGDMLYLSGERGLVRVQCPFASDDEVLAVADHWRKQGMPEFDQYLCDRIADKEETNEFSDDDSESHDELYDKAVEIVLTERKSSTSYIQRRLSIGYNRAANLIEAMERHGILSEEKGPSRKRDILVPKRD